jgi:thioesterase domain-containing protein
LAYEIACQFEAESREEGTLTMIDAVGPNSTHWAGLLRDFVADLEAIVPLPAENRNGRPQTERTCLSLLDGVERDDIITGIKDKTPLSFTLAIPAWETLGPGQSIASLRVIVAFVQALASYTPSCDLGWVVERFNSTEADGLHGGYWDRWMPDATGCRRLRGDHRSVLTPPLANEIAAVVNAALLGC